MTFDFDTRLRHVEKKLAELEHKDFLPPDLVQLVKKTVLRQLEARPLVRLTLPEPGDLTPVDRNLLGQPLLDRERFPFDQEQARTLFQEFLDILASPGGVTAKGADIIRQALASGELDLDRTFADFLRQGEASLSAWSERTPETPRAMHYLVQASLSPSLETVGFALSQNLGQAPRQHGHCPVCGSLPYMATLKEKEGFRLLNCSFCKAQYRVRRLACVYCDTADPDKLAYFDTGDSQGFRLDVCNVCHLYIKTMDFRSLDRVAVPELDDLISLPLDFLAQGRGYKRPVLSSWGF